MGNKRVTYYAETLPGTQIEKQIIINNKIQKMTPALTTQEIAARFNELAQQELWFEIQDELFADNSRSIEPPDSPYFGYAEGK